MRAGHGTAMSVLLAGLVLFRTPAAPTPALAVTAGSRPAFAPTVGLDDKIAQMILVGFRGTELTEESSIARDIRERHIGGVVLFDYDAPTGTRGRNIQSPGQVRALCAALQRLSATRLLIAVDQEGGMVARLGERDGFPPTLSARALGTKNNLDLTRQSAETMARTLAESGINLNLAPVVDLNTNPSDSIIGRAERSFSADPATVTRHALEVIRAHHRFGVLTTLKHFPGLGSSCADTHLGFADVTTTWTPAELEPYAGIIAAGECDAVMTAHIFNANLDPELPATLSRTIITGILRGQLKFEGVVISDDLQMGAISRRYGFDVAIQRAIEAGVDILVFANNSIFDENVAAKAVSAIRQMVQDGRVSLARIEESYRRIARLKAKLGMEERRGDDRTGTPPVTWQ